MHQNSLDGYDLLMRSGKVNAREKAVIKLAVDNPGLKRDFDFLQLFKPGSDNVNLVQPRITHLIDLKIFREGTQGMSPYQNSPVRRTELNPEYHPRKQTELIL